MNDFISTIKTGYEVIFPQISFRFATNPFRFAIFTYPFTLLAYLVLNFATSCSFKLHQSQLENNSLSKSILNFYINKPFLACDIIMSWPITCLLVSFLSVNLSLFIRVIHLALDIEYLVFFTLEDSCDLFFPDYMF